MNYEATVKKYNELITEYQLGDGSIVDILQFNAIVGQLLKEKRDEIK